MRQRAGPNIWGCTCTCIQSISWPVGTILPWATSLHENTNRGPNSDRVKGVLKNKYWKQWHTGSVWDYLRLGKNVTKLFNCLL